MERAVSLHASATLGAGMTYADRAAGLGPYVERSRADWAELAEHAQVSLDPATLERVRGLGDPTSMLDVREVYLPLTRLLSRYVLHTDEAAPLDERVPAAQGAADAVRDRHRRLGCGRQVDHRPAAARAAGRWPEHPGSRWSPPTGSCCPTPSWSGAA